MPMTTYCQSLKMCWNQKSYWQNEFYIIPLLNNIKMQSLQSRNGMCNPPHFQATYARRCFIFRQVQWSSNITLLNHPQSTFSHFSSKWECICKYFMSFFCALFRTFHPWGSSRTSALTIVLQNLQIILYHLKDCKNHLRMKKLVG